MNNSNNTQVNPNSDYSIKISRKPIDSGLYVIATPIGNISDITLRAISTLSSADEVYCEDTRVSTKLLSHYGIKRKLYAYNDYSDTKLQNHIVSQIKNNYSVALISDAGTPLISDPGFRLVQKCHQQNISVFAVPGASALTAALSISGAATDKFTFLGFIARSTKKRIDALKDISSKPETMVIFERASRVAELLEYFSPLHPNRIITIAREITKRFEQIITNTPAELLKQISNSPIKGEVVMIFHSTSQSSTTLANENVDHYSGLTHEENSIHQSDNTQKLYSLAQNIVASGKSVKDAVSEVRAAALAEGITLPKKSDIYRLVNKIMLLNKG